MRREDQLRLEQTFEDGETIERRLGVDLPAIARLIAAIRAEVDEKGVSWWDLEPKARSVLTGQLEASLRQIAINLAEARIHELEFRGFLESESHFLAEPVRYPRGP